MRLFGTFPAEKQPSQQERYILSISEADFNTTSHQREKTPSLRHEEKSMLSYFQENRFIKDGYTRVILSNFDFTKNSECNYLLPFITNSYTFANAKLTHLQVQKLIYKGVDLSASTYRTDRIAAKEYVEMISELSNAGLSEARLSAALKSMAFYGMNVNFDGGDFSQYPPYFVGACNPISLIKTTISQAQFDFLLQATFYKIKKLNFKMMNFSGLDISDFIKNYACYFVRRLTDHDQAINIDYVMIDQAIIDLEALAICCLQNDKFRLWFDRNHLLLTIKIGKMLCDIEIQNFISEIDNEEDFYGHIARALDIFATQNTITSISECRPGIKLLFIAHFMQKNPQSDIAIKIMNQLNRYARSDERLSPTLFA